MNTTLSDKSVVPVSNTLTPSEQRAFAQAQATGFVTVTKASAAAGSAWWTWCEVHEHPFVRVKLRSKTARVFVGLSTAGARFTPATRSALFAAFKRAGGRMGWPWGTDAAHCIVSRDIGEALAQELLAIAWACARETREACR